MVIQGVKINIQQTANVRKLAIFLFSAAMQIWPSA